jgi:predicted nucleic acid-binding protein
LKGKLVLVDTHVVLDLLLARKPFDEDAVAIASKVARGEFVAYLGATSVPTVHYIARKRLGTTEASRAIGRLLQLFQVAPVTEQVIRDAIDRGFADFEDAILDTAAELVGVEAIVTRDPEGFRRSRIAVFTPPEFLKAIDAARAG